MKSLRRLKMALCWKVGSRTRSRRVMNYWIICAIKREVRLCIFSWSDVVLCLEWTKMKWRQSIFQKLRIVYEWVDLFLRRWCDIQMWTKTFIEKFGATNNCRLLVWRKSVVSLRRIYDHDWSVDCTTYIRAARDRLVTPSMIKKKKIIHALRTKCATNWQTITWYD